MKLRLKSKNQAGFTIIELLIATAIFSSVLTIGLSGFIGVGKLYYRGLTVTQTQETAKQLFDEITSNIRLGSTVMSGTTTSGNGSQYYCIGSHRYTYILYNMVDTSTEDQSSNFGLLEDPIATGTCGDPFGDTPLTNAVEILGNQMRLINFNVQPVSGNLNLYEVDIGIAHGQDNALTSPNSPSAQCIQEFSNDSFCSITNLNTMVYENF